MEPVAATTAVHRLVTNRIVVASPMPGTAYSFSFEVWSNAFQIPTSDLQVFVRSPIKLVAAVGVCERPIGAIHDDDRLPCYVCRKIGDEAVSLVIRHYFQAAVRPCVVAEML